MIFIFCVNTFMRNLSVGLMIFTLPMKWKTFLWNVFKTNYTVLVNSLFVLFFTCGICLGVKIKLIKLPLYTWIHKYYSVKFSDSMLIFSKVKGPLSSLSLFLATENPLKIMKNAFFILKALFVLKMFTFLSWLSIHVRKGLDKNPKVCFKICDVTDWTTNN